MKDPKSADTEVKINMVNIIHLITANLYELWERSHSSLQYQLEQQFQ